MVQDSMISHSGQRLSETLSKFSMDSREYHMSSEEGSLLSENVEVCQLSESTTEDFDRRTVVEQTPRAKPKQKRQDSACGDKSKNVVDPRKYKTKLCRNWKATGQCPYEHTCCYAHGDLETRTMHQNNNVLSSLGYFSGIMLLAMKDDKPGGKGSKAAKKPQKNIANMAMKKLELPMPMEHRYPHPTMQLSTPTVHSPYCLPDAPHFGTESGPSSPLSFTDTSMPTYSFRMEGNHRASFSGGPYSPYPEPGATYDIPEYGLPVPGTYAPYQAASPLASPLAFDACYSSFTDPVGYEPYPSDPVYPQQHQLDPHQDAPQWTSESYATGVITAM